MNLFSNSQGTAEIVSIRVGAQTKRRSIAVRLEPSLIASSWAVTLQLVGLNPGQMTRFDNGKAITLRSGPKIQALAE